MEMFNFENLDILHLVLFSVPGYFLLAVGGFKFKSEFGHAISSFFWGFMFVSFTYFVLTRIKLMPQDIFNNPYTAMALFSFMAMVLGLLVANVRKKLN